mgnify:CR=1 FL=1
MLHTEASLEQDRVESEHRVNTSGYQHIWNAHSSERQQGEIQLEIHQSQSGIAVLEDCYSAGAPSKHNYIITLFMRPWKTMVMRRRNVLFANWQLSSTQLHCMPNDSLNHSNNSRMWADSQVCSVWKTAVHPRPVAVSVKEFECSTWPVRCIMTVMSEWPWYVWVMMNSLSYIAVR